MSVVSSTQIRLSALWAATIFCYLYCDYFALYLPGKVDSIVAGEIGPFSKITQPLMLAMGLLLLIPSLMVALSTMIPRAVLRPLTIVVSIFYTLMMTFLAIASSWWFYQMYAVVEALLTAGIGWLTWRWHDADKSTEKATL